MLIFGLIVTMGIGSSFSTLPIISAIYVPLCAAMGFSPLATVAIIGTAGALGDAGSPAGGERDEAHPGRWPRRDQLGGEPAVDWGGRGGREKGARRWRIASRSAISPAG